MEPAEDYFIPPYHPSITRGSESNALSDLHPAILPAAARRLSVKLRLATKNYRIPTKNAANKLSYNREEKALHGHNLQRDHDTGGTPAVLTNRWKWNIIGM